jgi:hypothetical protein
VQQFSAPGGKMRGQSGKDGGFWVPDKIFLDK